MKIRASLFLLTLACADFAAAMPPDRTIQKEVVVNAPIEAVWKAWTTSEGVATFFAPEAVVEPKPGGAFFVHINPYARPG
jgi:uncharacterized protein YndB with AHSA1/START domain